MQIDMTLYKTICSNYTDESRYQNFRENFFILLSPQLYLQFSDKFCVLYHHVVILPSIVFFCPISLCVDSAVTLYRMLL